MVPGLDFGEFCRRRRLEKGKTLREFCRENGLDAAQVSRLERGVLSPPRSEDARRKLAAALGLREGTEEWKQFQDLADICAGRLPAGASSDERVIALLPLFFRAVGKKGIDEDALDKLIERMKQELS